MFGWGELGIVAILAIILLGPERLPEVFRTLGKLYAEYNHAKKKLELEIIQGANLPQGDFLQKMSQTKMNTLTNEITSNLKESTENYLNIETNSIKRENTGKSEVTKDSKGSPSESRSIDDTKSVSEKNKKES